MRNQGQQVGLHVVSLRRVVLVVYWLALLFFIGTPALAATDSSVWESSAVTGGAALGAAAISGAIVYATGKNARGAAARADKDAQLRAVRQQIAEDVRDTVKGVGAELERAVSRLVETVGMDPEVSSEVLAKSSEVEARLTFIWDRKFREYMTSFTRLACEAATAELPEEVGVIRARAIEAAEAWEAANKRAGEIWRDFVGTVLPPEAKAA